MTSEERLTSLRLDPKDFPKRIELELSENVVIRINYLAEKSGRSFSEVAMDILSKALEPRVHSLPQVISCLVFS